MTPVKSNSTKIYRKKAKTTMPDPIISRERLERDARAAAKTYSDINDACPYPFGTDAARIFADEFKRARAVINLANYSNTNVPPAAKATTP